MPLKLAQAVALIERIADPKWAFEWDRVGLQVGNLESGVSKAIVSLDWSADLLEAATASGCQLIVCHHPLIWEPLTSLTMRNRAERFALKLIEKGIAFYACHTQWDCAPGGINDALTATLGLTDVRPFGEAAKRSCLKLAVFCPKGSEDRVIDAAARVGAGQIGAYSRCAFLSSGMGTFLGGEGANPAVGRAGQVESADEVRVEMVLDESLAGDVERAIESVHPYEEPAIDFYRLKDSAPMPLGRFGKVPRTKKLKDFADEVDARLGTRSLCWGDEGLQVQKVALAGGAAGSLWKEALAIGADVLVTGEVKQDQALEASEAGMGIIAAGHYATE